MTLNTTLLGSDGPLITFCHGLFGQGRNWTGIAKSLVGKGFRCLLVDLPNHGRSAWTEHLSFAQMAEAVAGAIRDTGLAPSVVVGHSLGGKVAMRLALDHPDLVSRLCVVDIAPAPYEGMNQFAQYIKGMRTIDLASLDNRAVADAQLEPAVPDPTVRGFLLQNLRHDTSPGGRGWFWQPNLDLIEAELDRIAAWEPTDAVYRGPVLWVGGAESDYIQPEHEPAMRALFPQTRRLTVKRAGHWVHSAQPEVFTEVLTQFAGGA